jgi:hypothetical protein
MTSKIDFNILLAKADKNTNNACKVMGNNPYFFNAKFK